MNNQKHGIVNFAKTKDWEIDDWIADEGVSGTKEPEQRQLGVLMKMCNPGDIIVCSELSRLGRKMLMVISILEYCMKNDIIIYTIKDNYVLGDNIQSSVLAFAFSLAAQIERDMISQRTKEALAVRRNAGVLLGSPRTANKISKVNEEIQKRMEEMAESGVPITRIAQDLKLHRMTVGYYLVKSDTFKGALDGYNITYFNDEVIHLTKRNCTDYGLYYKHISDAYKNNEDLTRIGIKKIEPKYRSVSENYRTDRFAKSENKNIDRKRIESLVLGDMTIPEIYGVMGSDDVSYDDIYDYISGDTYLSLEYRVRGHLRCKTPKKR